MENDDFEQSFTSSERQRLSRVIDQLRHQQLPAGSPNFVTAVMTNLPAGSQRQLALAQLFSEYFQPRTWLLAAAMLLGVFSLSTRDIWSAPVSVSTKELLLSEISDRQLFETLADSGNSDLFAVSSYNGKGI